MAEIRPFCCVHPATEVVSQVAALPYDVVSREEAAAIGKENPDSFLHVDRAEMDLPADAGLYDPEVYKKAKENLLQMEEKGILSQDHKPCYYIYELVRKGKVQTGIAGCASIDDYLNGMIKKHENTRREKEEDRVRHVDICDAQTGPIFLAYRNQESLKKIVADVKTGAALFDFTSEDGIRHRGWKIADTEKISAIYEAFHQMNALYIADGHHRAASAVRVGVKRREEHPGYTGEEEFNYFLSVIFPDDELMIMDYNRVVRELNGLTPEEFLSGIKKVFDVEKLDKAEHPKRKGQVTLFLEDKWYLLTLKPEYENCDPVEGLDVSILQKQILEPVLGIHDPKTDKRIDFVGGIRGLSELERRVHTDMKVAFAMYPTSIGELFAVADAGLLMPPKSTWFEPKLRSGLFIHALK